MLGWMRRREAAVEAPEPVVPTRRPPRREEFVIGGRAQVWFGTPPFLAGEGVVVALQSAGHAEAQVRMYMDPVGERGMNTNWGATYRASQVFPLAGSRVENIITQVDGLRPQGKCRAFTHNAWHDARFTAEYGGLRFIRYRAGGYDALPVELVKKVERMSTLGQLMLDKRSNKLDRERRREEIKARLLEHNIEAFLNITKLDIEDAIEGNVSVNRLEFEIRDSRFVQHQAGALNIPTFQMFHGKNKAQEDFDQWCESNHLTWEIVVKNRNYSVVVEPKVV